MTITHMDPTPTDGKILSMSAWLHLHLVNHLLQQQHRDTQSLQRSLHTCECTGAVCAAICDAACERR